MSIPGLGVWGWLSWAKGKIARGCWGSPGSPGVTGCHLLSGQSCGQWSLRGPDRGPARLTSSLGPWCVGTAVSLSRGPDTPKNPWRRTGWRDCGKPQAGWHVGRAGMLGLSCPHSLPGPAGLREDLARTPPWGLSCSSPQSPPGQRRTGAVVLRAPQGCQTSLGPQPSRHPPDMLPRAPLTLSVCHFVTDGPPPPTFLLLLIPRLLFLSSPI